MKGLQCQCPDGSLRTGFTCWLTPFKPCLLQGAHESERLGLYGVVGTADQIVACRLCGGYCHSKLGALSKPNATRGLKQQSLQIAVPEAPFDEHWS
eukprot:5458267-Amphidinium_carterae.1